MEIKIIKNKSEYQKALKQISELMDHNLIKGSKEGNAFELLLLVIKDYEQKVCESVVPDPIEAIKFRMDQMQFSRKDLIPFFGSMPRVSEVLSGRRNLSLAMIRKLHEGLGIPLESLISQKPRKQSRSRVKKIVKKFRVPGSRKKKKLFA